MAKIEVELDEFSDEDILEEFKSRIDNYDTDELKELLPENTVYQDEFQPDTMVDVEKFDLFKQNIKKFSLESFEKFIKENT